MVKLKKPLYSLDESFISKDVEIAKKEKFNKVIRRQLPFAMDGYSYAVDAVKKRWNINIFFYAGGHNQVKTILYPIGSFNEKPAEIWWNMMNKDPNFSQSLIDELKNIINIQKKLAESIPQYDISYEEIERLMIEHLEYWIEYFELGFLWFCVENIKDMIDEIVKKEWKLSSKELNNFLENVYRPMDLLMQSIEQSDLLKISLLKDNEFERALNQHIDKYNHLALFNIDDACFDREYYLGRLNSLKNPEEYKRQKESLDSAMKELKDATLLLENSKLSNEIKKRINFVRWFMYLRTNSIEYMMIVQKKYKAVFESMSKKLGISIEALLHMTYEEIINSIKNKKLIINEDKIIDRVENGCSYLITPNASYLVTGNEIDELEEMILPKENNLNITELKGQSAFKGKVRGKVRIILDRRNADEVLSGEILVTTMTTPDFVPAMRRSSGIITNEGGILCHAAIMSRELRKPCIIGTKKATDVLKTGDEVEVDADNGIVRILNKK